MAKNTILAVKNLTKTYVHKKVKTPALKGISFEIKKGEFIALSGPSGCGKSTTFHLIALLDNPTSGNIFFKEKDLVCLKEKYKTNFRLKKVGYVFQNYGLLPELTAIENICLPIMVSKGNDPEMIKQAEKILQEMDLIERKDFYPGRLSGGEQQRVAIARALMKNPEIILADEPTANLDSAGGKNVINILKKLSKEKGITVFVINHEKAFEKYFDRIIWLKDGRIDKK